MLLEMVTPFIQNDPENPSAWIVAACKEKKKVLSALVAN